MIVRDMARTPKACRLWKLKDHSVRGDFIIVIARSLLAWLEARPVLSASREASSSSFLRNFCQALESVNALPAPPPRLTVRAIRCINLLASRNEVR